jgi:hypothetical protein
MQRSLRDIPDPAMTEARPGPPIRVIPPVRIPACRLHIARPPLQVDQLGTVCTHSPRLWFRSVTYVANRLGVLRKQPLDYFSYPDRCSASFGECTGYVHTRRG